MSQVREPNFTRGGQDSSLSRSTLIGERALRVLVVELQGRGGLWHYAHAFSRALGQVGVVTALATTRLHEDLGELPIPIYIIGNQSSRSPRLPAALHRVWNHSVKLVHLAHLLDEFRPHIVHLQGPMGYLDFLYFRWLKHRGTKVVYTAHNPRSRDQKAGWAHRARHREADAIVVLSRSGVSDLVADGVEASKVFCVPHGNYLHLCNSFDWSGNGFKRRLGLPGTAQVVLFFGQIAPYKGLDLLIEAFALVRRENPEAYLVIVGRPTGTFSPYRQLIDQFGLADAIILKLEYVPLSDLPKYFLAADLVAFPYRQSYQSGVLQLAYGFARPVVVTDTSDLARQVSEDSTGLVAGFDSADFAASMRELLSKVATAAAMGKRGHQLAETKYSWAGIAMSSLDMYRKVCGLS